MRCRTRNSNRAREEVEEVLAKYTDLYDFAPVGYLTFDEKGLISELNLTAARLLGIERIFLLNKPFSSFIQRGFQDRFYLHLQEVLESSAKQTCELVLKKKDGATFDVQLESVAVKATGHRLVRSILTDISAHKQAEKAIQHFSSFPQMNPHPVLETDMSGALLFSNPASLRILKELALKKEDANLFLPEDLDVILRDWDKKTSVTLFREVIIKDRIFGETVQLVPEFQVVRIYAHEITTRKHAEEALQAAKDDLESRVKDRTTQLQDVNRALEEEIITRKQAEEAAKSERLQLFNVLETIPAYVILLTPDYHAPFANRVFRKILVMPTANAASSFFLTETNHAITVKPIQYSKPASPINGNGEAPMTVITMSTTSRSPIRTGPHSSWRWVSTLLNATKRKKPSGGPWIMAGA